MPAPLRVLLAWPPFVPSYFNAGHRLSVFTTAAYLRRADPGLVVRAVDAAALNYTWKHFGDILFEGWDAIGLANDFDAVDNFSRAIMYARELSPQATIVTFGRLSQQVPQLFHRFDLDGIVAQGDAEVGVHEFITGMGNPAVAPPGVWMRRGETWLDPVAPGRLIDADGLPLPDVRELPVGVYRSMGMREADRFASIPGKGELVVPVARGCPVGCAFCDVPLMQGRGERRLPVERVVEYIDSSFRSGLFEYVSFYAPTFTLRRDWVLSLVAALRRRGDIPWKCATTLRHLDEQLVTAMGAAGCVRISVGVETLDTEEEKKNLPRLKQAANTRLSDVVAWCQQAEIELNCFIMVGLPGATAESVATTIDVLTAAGVHIRPTAYTPFADISAHLPADELSRFNRHLLFGSWDEHERAALYRSIFHETGAQDRARDLIDTVRQGTASRSTPSPQ
jgi:anaerobic magnesium-protoporphyrin IX monomethyl ester cyclase